MLLSACATAPELPWLADQVAQRVEESAVEQMRALCAACPVRHHCADYVDAAGIVGGFWAGQPRWDRSLLEPNDLT